jgi:hypothetical protein
MTGWLVTLLYNACADFAAELGWAWQGTFIDTLRRTFFNRPGKLYCTPAAVIVYFDREFRYQGDLLPILRGPNNRWARRFSRSNSAMI